MDEQATEATATAPEKPKRESGAARRKDNRPRTLRGGVWRLDIWQPHAHVLRGRPRGEGNE